MPFPQVEPANDSPATMPCRTRWRTLAAVIVAFLPLLGPARAQASLSLDLSELVGDAIFGTTVLLEGGPGGGVTVTGNVAISRSVGTLTGQGGSTINGNVVFDSSVPVGHQTTTGITVTGTTSTADLSPALQQLLDASAALATAPATMTLPGGFGGGMLSLTGVSGLNVINVAHFDSGSIKLTGPADAIFVINVLNASNQQMTINGGVALSGGVTSDHVLFNILGTGQVGLSGTLNGTFIVPNAPVTFQGAPTLNGAILDGAVVTMKIDAQSNTKINNSAGNVFIQPADVQATPEPTTLGAGLSGLALAGLARLRSRKRPAA